MKNNIVFSAYEAEYSESKFWNKITSLVKYANEQIIYNALLLYYVLLSPDVPIKDKALIVGALGYLILPFDLIPDWIPALGLTDDAGALITVIRLVSAHITPEIRKQAKDKAHSLLY